MSTKISTALLVFLLLTYLLPAQSIMPATRSIEYEVLTADFQANSEPQSMRVSLNIDGTTSVENISIRLAGNHGKLTLLYAEKNGTALWLIQSSDRTLPENVLSWNYNDSSGVLRIFPFPYEGPYTLELEMQLNFNSTISSTENQQDTVIVETNLPSGVYEASVTGRGNKITITK